MAGVKYIVWFGIALLPLALFLFWYFTRARRNKMHSSIGLDELAQYQPGDDETHIEVTDTTDSIYSEIELLIAFSDFEKAKRKIQQARQKDSEDLWMLMLELKLLAASEDVENFNKKYAAYSPLLSRVYPSAWVQMEIIYKNINKN